MEIHRCGGTLKPQIVRIRKRVGYFYHAYRANGFKCDACEEEVISRDVALELEEKILETQKLWADLSIPTDTIETPAEFFLATGTLRYVPANVMSFDTGYNN